MAPTGLSVVRLFSNKPFAKNNTNPPFSFHGGLKLNTSKRALSQSKQNTIIDLPAPKELIVPLVDYFKLEHEPCVSINQRVVRGQKLSPGIVAPADGVVVAIEPRQLIHPGDLSALCVVIACDEHCNTNPQQQALHGDTQGAIAGFLEQPDTMLEQAALTGLGGAGFPTHQKLTSAANSVRTLIVNGAECEPEIACDEILMQTEASSIALGIDALIQFTQCEHCMVAIEDSKPVAIEQLSAAIESNQLNATVMVIPTRYPTGAESPLIEVLTGERIDHGTIPSELGILCVNVGTVYALWQAIQYGQALDSRVVSLGGASMRNPCNVRVRFGTPVSYILQQTDNYPINNNIRIRSGGPLSGFDLDSLEVPVTVQTNCILAEPASVNVPASACIRCGQCADVCPSRLLPQQLHWYAQNDDHGKCAQLNINACIECGCCDLVCPSSIKLTETFRHAKSKARFLTLENEKAAQAEQRFKEREQRLQQREAARQAAIAARKQSVKSKRAPDKDRIGAALERARSKQKPSKE